MNRTYVDPDTYLRRINNISFDSKDEVLNSLETYSRRIEPSTGTNWKIVSNGIIDKFSPILQLLNTTLDSAIDNYDNEEKLIDDLGSLLAFTTNFMKVFQDKEKIDEGPLNDDIFKAALCQYSHPLSPLLSESGHLIWSSIVKISGSIIESIFNSFKFSKRLIHEHYTETGYVNTSESKQQLLEFSESLINLLDTLNWSVFYQCKGQCGLDQICYTNSWGPSPLGGHPPLDGDHPRDGPSGPGQGYYEDHEDLGLYKDTFGKLRISKDLKCVRYERIFKKRSQGAVW